MQAFCTSKPICFYNQLETKEEQTMLRKLILAATLGAVALLSACGKKGDEFVGTWTEGSPDRIWVIARSSGNTFEVMKGDDKTTILPAHYQDGILNVTSVLGNMEIDYDKEHDSLKTNMAGLSLSPMTRVK
jgi:hypothetical protein